MKFNSEFWDNKAFRTSEQYAALIKAIFESLAKESIRLSLSVKPKTKNPFFFDAYPQLRNRVNKLFKNFANDLEIHISNSSKELWAFANKKNDALADVFPAIAEKYRLNGEANKSALQAFIERKEGGMKLSDRVWNIAKQSKQELEMAIDVSITAGKSAQQIASDVRQYLNEPDRLFRRVRDSRGQLHLSRRAASYHPGRGVYRSSYKNAMRLARSENNAAYRTADYNRWSAMDFVSGIQIKLSNNPHHCDVCATLQGKYPKDYKFIGWHPQCRCFAVPILISNADYDRLELMQLNDEDTSGFIPKSQVNDIPKAARKWFADNKERIAKYKALPYFISDNKQYFSVK